MSIETVKVMEPRVAVKPDVEKNHIVLMGGQRVTEKSLLRILGDQLDKNQSKLSGQLILHLHKLL
jgi:hypothetical protein